MLEDIIHPDEIDRLEIIAPLLSEAIDNHPNWGPGNRRAAYAELDRMIGSQRVNSYAEFDRIMARSAATSR